MSEIYNYKIKNTWCIFDKKRLFTAIEFVCENMYKLQLCPFGGISFPFSDIFDTVDILWKNNNPFIRIDNQDIQITKTIPDNYDEEYKIVLTNHQQLPIVVAKHHHSVFAMYAFYFLLDNEKEQVKLGNYLLNKQNAHFRIDVYDKLSIRGVDKKSPFAWVPFDGKHRSFWGSNLKPQVNPPFEYIHVYNGFELLKELPTEVLDLSSIQRKKRGHIEVTKTPTDFNTQDVVNVILSLNNTRIINSSNNEVSTNISSNNELSINEVSTNISSSNELSSNIFSSNEISSNIIELSSNNSSSFKDIWNILEQNNWNILPEDIEIPEGSDLTIDQLDFLMYKITQKAHQDIPVGVFNKQRCSYCWKHGFRICSNCFDFSICDECHSTLQKAVEEAKNIRQQQNHPRIHQPDEEDYLCIRCYYDVHAQAVEDCLQKRISLHEARK